MWTDILLLQSQREESGHAGIPFTFHFVFVLFLFRWLDELNFNQFFRAQNPGVKIPLGKYSYYQKEAVLKILDVIMGFKLQLFPQKSPTDSPKANDLIGSLE